MKVHSLKCPSCGAAMQSDSTTCPYCGVRVELVPELQQMRLLGFPCPRCGTLADKTARFCSECGETLLIKCPDCRKDIPLSAHVCPNCGRNRAAVSIIAEADEKRKRIESQTVARLEQLREDVASHEVFQQVKARLAGEAERLLAEAEQLRQVASSLSARSAAILVVALAAPLVFCGLAHLVIAAIGRGDAWSLSLLGGIPVFLTLAVASAVQFARSLEARREAAKMAERAADMRSPDAWRKYVTPGESDAIKAILEWAKQQEAGILQERDSLLAEVDKWLVESTKALT